MSGELKKIEFQGAVHSAVLCAKLLQAHDLPAMLAAIEHADAIGPLADPTLWNQNHKAMQQDREVLEAALPLWQLGKKLDAPMGEPAEEGKQP